MNDKKRDSGRAEKGATASRRTGEFGAQANNVTRNLAEGSRGSAGSQGGGGGKTPPMPKGVGTVQPKKGQK